MFMGRRRPLLRAAAVAGGSYVAGKHAAARRQQNEDQDARINALETQQGGSASAGTTPASAGTTPSIADELSRLAQLHQSGALTDQEFADAKAGLLGSSR